MHTEKRYLLEEEKIKIKISLTKLLLELERVCLSIVFKAY